MTANTLIQNRRVHRASKNGLLKLGWLHFWLLSSILAGMLALVALVFFADLMSR